jgi:hypothetical protein
MSDLPMSDFERRFERRVVSYAEAYEPLIDADRIAYAAEDAARVTTRRWFGLGAGTWVPVLLGLLLLIGAAVFAAGVLLTLLERKPLAGNGLIAYEVFESIPSSRGQIRVLQPDGSDDHAVGEGKCPRFLGDGAALTYLGEWDGFTESTSLTFAEPDGSSSHESGDVQPLGLDISPDGKFAAELNSATRTEAAGGEIYVTDLADGSRRLLVPASTDGDLTYAGLTWSPDGSSIAFAVMQRVEIGDNTGRYRKEVDVVDVKSGVVRVVSSRPGTDDIYIAWSPSSGSIAYLGLPDGSPVPALPVGESPIETWDLPEDVFVVRSDGTGDRDITASAQGEITPAWSPSGSAIAYRNHDDGALAVAEIDAADGNLNRYYGPVAASYAWSPDASALLYSATEFDSDGEGVVRSTLSKVDWRFQDPPETIVDTQEVIGCVSWQAVWPR